MSSPQHSVFDQIRANVKNSISVGHRVCFVLECGEDAFPSRELTNGLRLLVALYFSEWRAMGCPTIAPKDQLVDGTKWQFLVISHMLSILQPVLKHAFADMPITLRYHSPHDFMEVALGQTTHFMIYDLRNGAHPNTMGRILETLSGGGLLLILCRTLDEYQSLVDPSVHEFVMQFPHELEDIRPIFFSYLRKSLEALPFLTIEDLKVLCAEVNSHADYNVPFPEYSILAHSSFIKKKSWTPLNSEFNGFPVTKDQKEALRVLYEIVSTLMTTNPRKREGKSIFLSSKRGRGKSTVLGLCVAHLITERIPSRPIVITSPHVENVQVVFHAVHAYLQQKGIKCRMEFDETSHMIRGVSVGRRVVIKYRDPMDALKEKGSLIMVDEAGSIPIPVLKRFMKKFDLVIFSSTEHGYEGTGRSFTFRFQKELEADHQLLTKIVLQQPIRHGDGDPLEQWLHETLLLDAEPPKLMIDRKSIDLNALELVHLDKKELFFDRIDLLRNIVGILVSSHYRNQPNDLLLMADAPHIHVYGIFHESFEESGTSNHENRRVNHENQPVGAMLVSIEGGFSPEIIPSDPLQQRELRGNVVALTMYRTVDHAFPQWKGARIVRIAVHPEYQNIGIGSQTLRLFELACQQQGLDWVGTSFGGTPELINFWKKNGYTAVHVRPTPSSTTGECSIIMIKSHLSELKQLFTQASEDLRLHILHWTRELWWYFEPEEILAFIEATTPCHAWRPPMTVISIYRLTNYLNRTLTYHGAMGAINNLAWSYFLKYPEVDVHLAPIQQKILVVKNLQGWDWNHVIVKFGGDSFKIQGLYVKSLKKLRKWFLNKHA